MTLLLVVAVCGYVVSALVCVLVGCYLWVVSLMVSWLLFVVAVLGFVCIDAFVVLMLLV